MKRVLLKLSGEALSGKNGELYDNAFVDRVANALITSQKEGFEVAVVVGAGNIWRGRQGGEMDRATADHMGMLATVINSLCLKDAIVRAGGECTVMTAIPMSPFTTPYSAEEAMKKLKNGEIIIFGCGLGMPFVSTDTAGAVRAAEIQADAMFMAKNIDYIYTADPRVDPTAQKLLTVSCSEILARGLRAIDATAAAFCQSVGLPIHIFGLSTPEDIVRALRGEKVGTIVTAD
ncbi:MAG: uridine monophosphate kinase [Clostridia bacterium]|nr:uridine monophosphate kinase [Clostridia bacterium]